MAVASLDLKVHNKSGSDWTFVGDEEKAVGLMRLSHQRGGRKIVFTDRKNIHKINQINVCNIQPKTLKHEGHHACSKSRKRPHAAVKRNATSFIAARILTVARKFGMCYFLYVWVVC